jgi:hypothetical protein
VKAQKKGEKNLTEKKTTTFSEIYFHKKFCLEKGEICRKQKPKRICCSDETNYYYSMLTQKPVLPYLFVLTRLEMEEKRRMEKFVTEKVLNKKYKGENFKIEIVCN